MEFDQAWPQPERAECLGDTETDFAAHVGKRAIPGPHQPECSLFHLFRGQENLGTLRGGTNAVDMSGDEDGAKRALKIVDLATQGIGGKPKTLGGRAKTAIANQLQEGANRFPVRRGRARARTGILRTTPVRNRMHTIPHHRP